MKLKEKIKTELPLLSARMRSFTGKTFRQIKKHTLNGVEKLSGGFTTAKSEIIKQWIALKDKVQAKKTESLQKTPENISNGIKPAEGDENTQKPHEPESAAQKEAAAVRAEIHEQAGTASAGDEGNKVSGDDSETAQADEYEDIPEEEIRVRWRDLYLWPERKKKPGRIYGILFIIVCVLAVRQLIIYDAEPDDEQKLQVQEEIAVVTQTPAVPEDFVMPDYSQNPDRVVIEYEHIAENFVEYEIRNSAAYAIGASYDLNSIVFLTISQQVSYKYPVVEVCDEAFMGGSKIWRVSIPEGIVLVGESAFENCTDLCKVGLPDSVVKIGSRAFAGCTDLESIIIPKNVIKLPADVFEGDEKLTYIRIPLSCDIPEGDDPFGLGENCVIDFY